MAKKKTWTEKLAEAKAKTPEPHRRYCEKSRQLLLIPTVQEIEAHMRDVSRGRLTTMGQISETLRARYEVDLCCPMTTGIFAWIVAHAADEQERGGRKRVVPWWRTVKTGGELNPRYPGQGEVQRARLEAEGHRVVRKGKKLVVVDHERALLSDAVRATKKRATHGGDGSARPRKAAPARIDRRVLDRDDFGRCVLVPKTEWKWLPDEGPARVDVDGSAHRMVVQVERCNCQGNGWHEHRFLSFGRSAKIAPGQRVTILFPDRLSR
ncbi:MAG: MGMT family protein [Polyangiaceae bacterium]|nr:MGMT family protein [Polyangiaceae bacterium]